MNPYEVVKDNVTARQVAEKYGLRFGKNNRALCPWHDDHTPDLAFYDRGTCYCHACHNGGDAIALTCRIFNESPHEAAERIINDFGLLSPTSEYQIKTPQNTAIKTAENNFKQAQHEYIIADSNVNTFTGNTDSKSYKELLRRRELAAQWLQFKRIELKNLKEGISYGKKDRGISEFSTVWCELCETVHKCEKKLAKYTPETIDDEFYRTLDTLVQVNQELNLMYETNSLKTAEGKWKR